MRNNLKYKVLIILQCCFFGFAFIAIKNLCLLNVPSFLLIGIRFAIGSLGLFLFNIIFGFVKNRTSNREGKKIFNYSKPELVLGIIAGVVMFVAFAFQTFGAETTSPAKNALFTDLFIVFTPIISGLVHKRFSLQPLISSLIAITGVLVVLRIFNAEPTFSGGDVLSIICGIVFSIHFLLLEKFAQNSKYKLNVINFTIVQFVTTAILSILLSLFFEANTYHYIRWGQAIFWLIYAGLIASAVAYVIQFVAQSHISANDTALLSGFEAVFSLVFALIFKLDVFSWSLIIGAGIILIAFILSSLDLTRFKRTKSETSDQSTHE